MICKNCKKLVKGNDVKVLEDFASALNRLRSKHSKVVTITSKHNFHDLGNRIDNGFDNFINDVLEVRDKLEDYD